MAPFQIGDVILGKYEVILIGNPKKFLDAKTGVESWEYPLHERKPIQR